MVLVSRLFPGLIAAGWMLALTGCQHPAAPARSGRAHAAAHVQRYELTSERSWQLNLPQGQRFDASALVLLPDGDLLTLNDRGTTLYRIHPDDTKADLDLTPLAGVFTEAQLAPFAREKIDRYDCEGLARDDQGRIYVSEEANRWILRWDARENRVERLGIDWAPVRRWFHPTDRNCSFEGVAVGGNRLYVANERERGRLIVVDLNTMKVVDDFGPRPPGRLPLLDVHYSDLSWFDGSLYVLLRDTRQVLRVDPETHAVLAQYRFAKLEKAADNAYVSKYPGGIMEGLAVDRSHIWLATDNNGCARRAHPQDIRPTLFRCRRPD